MLPSGCAREIVARHLAQLGSESTIRMIRGRSRGEIMANSKSRGAARAPRDSGGQEDYAAFEEGPAGKPATGPFRTEKDSSGHSTSTSVVSAGSGCSLGDRPDADARNSRNSTPHS